ncbi:MAG: hypothetical protein V1820_03865 [archaeon]
MARRNVTSIQVSPQLLSLLKRRKFAEKESYEEVILSLIEDVTEISEEAKEEIASARREARAGKVVPFSKVRKGLGI